MQQAQNPTLHLKLYLVEHYDSIKIYYTKRDESEKATNSTYTDVTLFHQIINNTEYLYVIGKKGNSTNNEQTKNDKNTYTRVIERYKMDDIKEIDILKAGNHYKACKCD